MDDIKIARVFPRKTKATPEDDLAFYGPPPRLLLPEVDEVHVSATFTYDRDMAEFLASQWEVLGVPVKVGGPAYNDEGGVFTPGMYVKKGYVMTSRGCNNNCWFCMVPKREGKIREIPITEGHNVLDSNLLQCSDAHIHKVFNMLETQPEQALFTGGLEARKLKKWHCERLRKINPKRIYFAYDTPEDYEPLETAANMLWASGFRKRSHVIRCYCLIGYTGDTFDKAENRMLAATQLGFLPYAMLYRDQKGETDPQWRRFQREWCRPQIVASKIGNGSGVNEPAL